VSQLLYGSVVIVINALRITIVVLAIFRIVHGLGVRVP
jgi:hypothetical protein